MKSGRSASLAPNRLAWLGSFPRRILWQGSPAQGGLSIEVRSRKSGRHGRAAEGADGPWLGAQAATSLGLMSVYIYNISLCIHGPQRERERVTPFQP